MTLSKEEKTSSGVGQAEFIAEKGQQTPRIWQTDVAASISRRAGWELTAALYSCRAAPLLVSVLNHPEMLLGALSQLLLCPPEHGTSGDFDAPSYLLAWWIPSPQCLTKGLSHIAHPFRQWTHLSAGVSSAASYHRRGTKGAGKDNAIRPVLPWCKSWILKNICKFFPQTESRFQTWRIKFSLGIFPSKWTTQARLKLEGLHKAASCFLAMHFWPSHHHTSN